MENEETNPFEEANEEKYQEDIIENADDAAFFNENDVIKKFDNCSNIITDEYL